MTIIELTIRAEERCNSTYSGHHIVVLFADCIADTFISLEPPSSLCILKALVYLHVAGTQDRQINRLNQFTN
jgi:hypothetical protein